MEIGITRPFTKNFHAQFSLPHFMTRLDRSGYQLTFWAKLHRATGADVVTEITAGRRQVLCTNCESLKSAGPPGQQGRRARPARPTCDRSAYMRRPIGKARACKTCGFVWPATTLESRWRYVIKQCKAGKCGGCVRMVVTGSTPRSQWPKEWFGRSNKKSPKGSKGAKAKEVDSSAFASMTLAAKNEDVNEFSLDGPGPKAKRERERKAAKEAAKIELGFKTAPSAPAEDRPARSGPGGRGGRGGRGDRREGGRGGRGEGRGGGRGDRPAGGRGGAKIDTADTSAFPTLGGK